MKQGEDQELIAALKGDRDALSRLLLRESERLSKRVAARLASSPFADFSTEDVLQEVFCDLALLKLTASQPHPLPAPLTIGDGNPIPSRAPRHPSRWSGVSQEV